MAQDNNIEYPLAGFHFRVDFLFGNKESTYAGPHEAAFQEITGLKASIETKDTEEAGFAGQPRAIITGRKFDNVVLKRGLIYSNKIIDWFQESLYTKIIKHAPVIITALGTETSRDKGLPMISWMLYEAYPISYEVSGFDALKSQYLIETVNLRYSYFVQIKTGDITGSVSAQAAAIKSQADAYL